MKKWIVKFMNTKNNTEDSCIFYAYSIPTLVNIINKCNDGVEIISINPA